MDAVMSDAALVIAAICILISIGFASCSYENKADDDMQIACIKNGGTIINNGWVSAYCAKDKQK
jgi:hypothetical protein